MSLFAFFRRPKPVAAATASAARDRLQVLLAHERSDPSRPEILMALQRDILDAIQRRMSVGRDAVDIRLQRDEDLSTLEINIDLPGPRHLSQQRAC